MRIAVSTSLVQIEAVRPYRLSFINRTASSSSFTAIRPTTGPNVSSVMIRIR